MEKERVSVNEAAEILGMAPHMVRFRMKRGTLPIGKAIPPGGVLCRAGRQSRLKRTGQADGSSGFTGPC